MIDTTPEDLTILQFRRHPVREAIFSAAYHGERGLPTDRDLDALKLAPGTRRKVAAAARDAAAVNASVAQQDAWRRGNRAAAEIVESLPPAQRDPDYLKPVEPEVTDPRKLAADLPRC